MNARQTVTVISWNLNHWRNDTRRREAAWHHLDEGLAAEVDWDIALLQECQPPDSRDRPTVWQPVRDHDWGTAVTTRHAPLRAVRLEDHSHPGCAVAADVDLGARGTVTAVSLYGLQEYAKKIDGEPYPTRYAVTALHRMLSDLTPLIDHHSRHRNARPLLLGGDLNISTQIDPPDRQRHVEVLERFASLGLEDAWQVSPDSDPATDCTCPWHPTCRHVRTHTHPRSTRPWQLDYIFTNRRFTMRSCRTVVDEDTWHRSDHAPIAATLEFA